MTEYIGDQFVCYTKDGKYKVHSVSEDEFDELANVFESYLARTKFEDSMLIEWFGLFCVKFSDVSVYVYVTENPAYNGYEVAINSSEILKRVECEKIDFESVKKIVMDSEQLNKVSENLVTDTKVLAKFHFLVYSLWAKTEFS